MSADDESILLGKKEKKIYSEDDHSSLRLKKRKRRADSQEANSSKKTQASGEDKNSETNSRPDIEGGTKSGKVKKKKNNVLIETDREHEKTGNDEVFGGEENADGEINGGLAVGITETNQTNRCRDGVTKKGEKKKKRDTKIGNTIGEDGSTLQHKDFKGRNGRATPTETGDGGNKKGDKSKGKGELVDNASENPRPKKKGGEVFGAEKNADGETNGGLVVERNNETNQAKKRENGVTKNSEKEKKKMNCEDGVTKNGEKKKKKMTSCEDGSALLYKDFDDRNGRATPTETGDGGSKKGDKSKKKGELVDNASENPGSEKKDEVFGGEKNADGETKGGLVVEENNGINHLSKHEDGVAKNGEKKKRRKRDKKNCNMIFEEGSALQHKDFDDRNGHATPSKTGDGGSRKGDKSKKKRAEIVGDASENPGPKKKSKKKVSFSNDMEIFDSSNANPENSGTNHLSKHEDGVTKNDEKKKRRKRDKKNCNMIFEEGSALQHKDFDDRNGHATPSETGDGGSRKGDKSKKKRAEIVDDASENPGPKKKSKKKVSFSNDIEIFDSSNANPVDGLVRGKRFTQEEDDIIRKAVYDYIEGHGLEEEKGIDMLMHSRSHPELKDCWKDIGSAIPYRPYSAIYYRAHILFERSDERKWTEEEYELLRKSQQEHGNNWKLVAEELGKHRFHVKDTWRRIKNRDLKKGIWSQQEYQALYDLVNMDLQMKVFRQEKSSKHGMLRDDIPWGAISDKLTTRAHAACCMKWYHQLTSSMVEDGMWSDGDDYRLIDALYNRDDACVEDVDWDNLLEHRSGDVCRKRWDQMVLRIGHHALKPFSEQVEILACRYCPELAEARDKWDNLPVVP